MDFIPDSTCCLQSVESGNIVLDGGYIDLDPAKLASISPTTSSPVSGTSE